MGGSPPFAEGPGRPFVSDALGARVVFGPGARNQLGAELDRLNIARALVVTTAGRRQMAEQLAAAAAPRIAGVELQNDPHVSLAEIEAAMARLSVERIDGLVAIGGGSALGLSKALARRTKLPQIAVPTTYAGSEMTQGVGETHDGVKRLFGGPEIRPATVIYDPELTLTLPVAVSVASGFNALAHAIGCLYAPREPAAERTAGQAIGLMLPALRRIITAPQDAPARADALYAACLAGASMGSMRMALHHRLCHALGAAGSLPHAATHAVLLPYVLDYNRDAAPHVLAALQQALGEPEPAGALQALSRQAGVPRSLAEFGCGRALLARVAEMVATEAPANPEPYDRSALQALLDSALQGAPIAG